MITQLTLRVFLCIFFVCNGPTKHLGEHNLKTLFTRSSRSVHVLKWLAGSREDKM
jgi:hypothetical protein